MKGFLLYRKEEHRLPVGNTSSQKNIILKVPKRKRKPACKNTEMSALFLVKDPLTL